MPWMEARLGCSRVLCCWASHPQVSRQEHLATMHTVSHRTPGSSLEGRESAPSGQPSTEWQGEGAGRMRSAATLHGAPRGISVEPGQMPVPLLMGLKELGLCPPSRHRLDLCSGSEQLPRQLSFQEGHREAKSTPHAPTAAHSLHLTI